MFTCIACSKNVEEDAGDADSIARGNETPTSKDAVKSLTTQIKDMALKFSGGYKQYKPGNNARNFRKGQRPYPDFDTASNGVPYPLSGSGSSGSTSAWDFFSGNHHRGARRESRFATADRTETVSTPSCDAVFEDEDETKEWMAQVEPGVHITFVSLPNVGNDLKRIRFSREMFNKWQAQRWWGENYDRIMELYNVQRFNRQALHTPTRSEDEVCELQPRDSSCSKFESESPMPVYTPRNHYMPADASSRDEAPSFSNASEMETEWVEEDEAGVFITIRQLADGTKELRRVRFSRERFGEMHAKTWWERNRERIQDQYLCATK